MRQIWVSVGISRDDRSELLRVTDGDGSSGGGWNELAQAIAFCILFVGLSSI
jgi:hypothetical protein